MANTLLDLLVGSTVHRCTEGPSSRMVSSCCSRSQGSCFLCELLGYIVTLSSVLLVIPKGYISKICELWDYWIQLIVQGCCAGSLSSCFPVLFLQDDSVSSAMEKWKGLGFSLAASHAASNVWCILKNQLKPHFLWVAAQHNIPGGLAGSRSFPPTVPWRYLQLELENWIKTINQDNCALSSLLFSLAVAFLHPPTPVWHQWWSSLGCNYLSRTVTKNEDHG